MIVGLLLNLVVVVANGGMPVRAEAITTSGGDPAVLQDSTVGKHHLMTEDDVLWHLGDVIGSRAPISSVAVDRRHPALRRDGVVHRPGDAGTEPREPRPARDVVPFVPREARPEPLADGGSATGLLVTLEQSAGNRTVIVVPSPDSLVTSIFPPPTWARSRIIAIPK